VCQVIFIIRKCVELKSVVHVITTIARGGAENQLKVVVREQVKSGYKVKVIYLKGIPELLIELQIAGAEVIDVVAGKNPLSQVHSLKRFFKNYHGVVHAHLPRAELLSALTSPRDSLVVSRHNSEPFFPIAPTFLSRILSRFVESKATRVVAISGAVKKYLLDNGEISTSGKIEVVYYGFDELLTKTTTKTKQNSNKDFVIGTVGRLVHQKDYPTLFAAFKKFATGNHSAKLLIVGDGPLKKQLVELARKLGIEKDIIWFGRTSEVFSIIKQMDLFVLASKYEGFGLVLLEAIQAGIPVVAANNSAIPEVLGVNSANLFRTGDSADLYSKMKDFQSEPKRGKLIEAQFSRLSCFSPENMITKMNLVYDPILARLSKTFQ
jgi:glycosyltransferase involved in cell wall biosynthesis